MKKILFVFEGIYNGGTEVATINLIKKLNTNYICHYSYFDKENSDKKVISSLNGISKEFINDENKEYYYDNIIFCTSIVKDLKKYLKNIKSENVFFWFHYFWEDQINFINENKFNIDKIISVSDSCTKKLKQEYNITKEIITINNIFDIEEIKNKSLETVNIKQEKNKIKFLSVGRIAPIKGYDKLEDIIKIFEKNHIDFEWYILGKANAFEKEFNKKIDNIVKQNDNIHILGHKDNPYKYMKNVDYIIVLSQNETWSLVITEAKILTTPCITTNFEAAYEQIENKENGYIFDINNLKTFDDICKEIIKGKENIISNLKKFKYNNEKQLQKWYNILN